MVHHTDCIISEARPEIVGDEDGNYETENNPPELRNFPNALPAREHRCGDHDEGHPEWYMRHELSSRCVITNIAKGHKSIVDLPFLHS